MSTPRDRGKKQRGPRSKIASLPARVREELCVRLHDGQREPEILPWLHALPEVQQALAERCGGKPVNSQNLSEWRRGGFRDWLLRRERAEEMKLLSAYALQMAQAAGTQLSEGAAAIAGGRILELLEQASGDDLVGLAGALAKMRDAEAKLIHARVAQENLARKDEALRLAWLKFERDTAKLFIRWFADEGARRIVESKASRMVKMDRLVELMFGPRPAAEPEPAAPEPAVQPESGEDPR